VIGPYKLLQLIGTGGMGEVWMAEQDQPVRRRVALKLIKAGMDSRQVIARFEAERQALALMDHPHIARVLDAGTTPEGRPYFVMELIRGEPMTTYCDANHLTPRERLELFVPVCQAVQHAHQKGIIHRDLKPSNVLVTLCDGRPVPKVIDFGVAKALHQRLTERTMVTEFGQVVGTLEYMAPEQAELSHLDVDTRADVYALGVLLYELLTGATPFEPQRLHQAALDEVLRILREEEPPRPSTRLSSSEALPAIAAARRTEPAQLSRLVRGELDWIVMKALEKDRARRYETANGLARDLQRYLADEAVEAGPPSAAYRLRKLARRYRGALLTAAAFMALLAVAAVVSTWQAVVATRAQRDALAARDAEAEQRRRTRQALDDMLSEESLAFLTTQQELLPQQRAFLERALQYYREFAARAATEEEGRALEAGAQFRVGRILQALGRRPPAERAYRAARALYETLAAEHPGVPAYRRELAGSHNNLGYLLNDLGQRAEAEAALRAALVIREKLAAEHPAVPAYRADLATSHNNLGNLLKDLGQPAAAAAAYRAALVIQGKLAAEHPAVPDYRRSLAGSHYNLGMLLNDLGQRAEAEAALRAALVLREKLAAEHPAVPDYRADLASSHNNLGNLLKDLGQPAAAAAYRAALVIRGKLAAEHPAVPDYRRSLAGSHNDLGLLLAGLGQRAEAEAEYRTALALQERLAADFPAVPAHAVDLGGSYCNFGHLVGGRGEPAAALDWYAKAVATLEPVHRADPRLVTARQFLRNSHRGRGQALVRLNRPAEALADLNSALALQEKLVADFPDVPEYRRDLVVSHNDLGLLVAGQGKRAEAEAEYRAALALQERLAADFPAVPDYAVDLGGRYCNFGNLVHDRGEPAAALDWYAKAVATLELVHRAEPQLVTARQFLRNSHWGRADALVRLSRPAEALADWERALALDDGSARTALGLGRADALARAGEGARALAAADEVAAAGRLPAGALYNLACAYALAAAKLPPADAERAAAKAVATLRRAVAAGYRDAAHMQKDSDLDALRRRDDYAALLWDLADRPATRPAPAAAP
jgi:tetratricopeptide (TPR) repeat protein